MEADEFRGWLARFSPWRPLPPGSEVDNEERVMTRGRMIQFVVCSVLVCLAWSHADAQPLQPANEEGVRLSADGSRRMDLLCVTFRDGHAIRLRDGKLSDLGTAALNRARPELDKLELEGCAWDRAFGEFSEERLDQMRGQALQRGGRAAPDLNLRFYLQVPAGVDGEAVAQKLSAMDVVEHVEFAPMPLPAPVPPDFTSMQGYRTAAPNGVGATEVSSALGGTGAGVSVADVEYSWNLQHADLPSVTLIGPAPVDPFNDPNHGTAVLGQMVGKVNSFGVTGIAPDATAFVVAANTASGFSVGSAILRAVDVLPAGSVILLEQQAAGPNYTGGGSQFGLVPVEWNRFNYDAIVTAVANGIIVVEAAGNGSQNLDDPVYSTGNGGHWPFLPQNDSGAIIVGAGAWSGAASPRSRLSFSCYGSTVDLQGWGQNVTTAGYGGLYSFEGENQFYTSTFSGTSSASPIVAGACLLLQSYAKANIGLTMTPAQIRDTLVATGTPQNVPSQHIGPLPNVQAAFASIVLSAPGSFNLQTPAPGAVEQPVTPTFVWAPAAQAVSYSFTIDDDMNFGSPHLQVTGLTQPTYTIAPAMYLSPSRQFFWKVTASNLLGTTSSTPAVGSFWTTTSLPPTPGEFALLSPFSGAVNVSTTAILDWQDSLLADFYSITIDDNADFSSPHTNAAIATSSTFSLSATPLLIDTTYYWKVIATNASGSTPSLSGTATFTTVCIVPGSFSLLSPADGPNISTATPTLSWGASSSADSYSVVIDDSQSLDSPVYQASGILAPNHSVPSGVLVSGIRYYWRVRAINGACETVSTPGTASFGVLVPFCMGDADRNRVIDFSDITAVLGNWGQSGPLGDADNNALVNFGDITAVLSNWQRACPE